VKISTVVIPPRIRKDLGDIAGLAASIEAVGLLHPIVIDADNRLIAGARRIAAYKHLGRDSIPAIMVKNLSEKLLALRAQGDENTCRKDFAPSEAVACNRGMKPQAKAEASERKKAGKSADGKAGGRGKKKPGGKKPQGLSGKSRDVAAAVTGKSATTLRKAEAVVAAAEADPSLAPIVAKMDETGNVNAALREVTRAQRQATREAEPPTGRYRVIYADPPWQYGNAGLTEYGHAESHYPTVPLADLCAMSVRAWAEDDAVLFLWVTSPMLEDAFEVIRAWGFTYKTSFVWDKVKHNFGHYNSVRHELLLVCTRGSCTPDASKLFDSVQTIERSDRHSQKPEEFRQIIETLYTHGEKLELFARATHPGWKGHGNQL